MSILVKKGKLNEICKIIPQKRKKNSKDFGKIKFSSLIKKLNMNMLIS